MWRWFTLFLVNEVSVKTKTKGVTRSIIDRIKESQLLANLRLNLGILHICSRDLDFLARNKINFLTRTMHLLYIRERGDYQFLHTIFTVTVPVLFRFLPSEILFRTTNTYTFRLTLNPSTSLER